MSFRFEGSDGEDIETMWVIPLSNAIYEIANVPFYVKGIACGDELEGAVNEWGELEFVRAVKSGDHSTLRVLVWDEADRDSVCKRFEQLGCQGEISDIKTLIAIDVPPTTRWDDIQSVLRELVAAGTIDFQEAAISRHHLP